MFIYYLVLFIVFNAMLNQTKQEITVGWNFIMLQFMMRYLVI